MNALQKLRESGRSVELLPDGHVRIAPPPPKAWIPRLVEAKPEIINALKSEQAEGNRISRDEAEKLAVRTVWHYTMEKGDHGKFFSNDLTYQEARRSLECKFQRKVSNIEFISATAEGFGFVAYRPEMGGISQ